MAVTLQDIAKAAHVSVSTVSRALSHSNHPLNSETRERILKLAQEMGYQPNLLARGLRQDKSFSVGIIVDNIDSIFAPAIIRGIQDVLDASGYTCFIVNSDWKTELERASAQVLVSRSVDGLIFVDTWLHADDIDLDDLTTPRVFVNRLFSRANCICPDDAYGARLAVEHLVALGHRRIAFINGPEGWAASENRLTGYRDALNEHALDYDPRIVFTGDWEVAGGYQGIMQMLQIESRPTAVFAGNDVMALGVIYALQESGLRVPEDIAVVGYDNQDFARLANPTITTVTMPSHTMGILAARSLLDLMNGGSSTVGGLLSVRGELIIRESCGDPRGKYVTWSSSRDDYFSRSVPASKLGKDMVLSLDEQQTQCWRPVPWNRVEINDRFWTPRLERNHKKTLPAIFQKFEERGYLKALELKWQLGEPDPPHIFWESDIGKWLEAASYTLAIQPDPELEEKVDTLIALLAAAQQPDGYLNAYFTVVEPDKRWTNLRDWHELYCAGHLIEAAVAHHAATDKRTLLDVMIRYADYIDSVFGPTEGQKRGYPGHPELELALVKLYRVTGEARYLALSQFFVEERGKQPHYYDVEARARGEDPHDFWAKTYEYNQSHLPVREQSEAVGHAVRAVYLYAAMTDLAQETGDPTLTEAVKQLYESAVHRRMYVTGGIGSGAHNEGFTSDYNLPNDVAYAETCASIGLFLWMHRLAHLERDGQYVDVMERALYNGILSGVSLSGDRFFYRNVLAIERAHESRDGKSHHRRPWYGTACCPPNIARLLAGLGGYVYSEASLEAVVHFYVGGTAQLRVAGRAVTLTQTTDYPWDGTVTFGVKPEASVTFTLKLRIPSWCERFSLTINGKRWFVKPERGYIAVERCWEPGDKVVLDMDMPVDRVYAHPLVGANRGRVALQRGPIIYCVEGVDNDNPIDLISLPRAAQLVGEYDADLLDGVVMVTAAALRAQGGETSGYSATSPEYQPHPLKAVPYFAWDNRESGDMLVWMHEHP